MKPLNIKTKGGNILKKLHFRKSGEKKEKSKLAKMMEPLVKIFNRFSIVFHFVLAFIIYFAIEAMSRHSVPLAWNFMTSKFLVYLYNVFLIFVTFSLVYLVRRRCFARILLSAFWLILGFTNGYMLAKRVTPFNGPDLKMVFDLTTMIKSYFDGPEIILLIVGIAAVIIWLVYMWINGPKYEGKIHRLWALAGVGIWSVLFVFVTNAALDNRLLSNYFGNIAFAYEDYGFAYCFTNSVFGTGINQPSGYSEETIDNILKSEESAGKTKKKDKMPNILMIQLESFFDPKDVEFLNFDKDPIPNLRKLMKKYSTGYFKVPSVGAGTANTEFEVLTGMNMRFFGPGEYPYKTILQKQTCESAASDLKNIGYGTHAIHNNGGNFYSRAKVFSQMGFDTFTSKEFMDIQDWTPNGWSKDTILTNEILSALDSTEDQDFVFTISVQGHGEYPREQVLFNPDIKVTAEGKDEGTRLAWEYYVNMVYEMDQFVGELIEKLEERGEDTVLMMYGDHLPTMGLEAEEMKDRYLFNTEYVIWDNMGLKKNDQNLTAYQITSEILDRLDIHEGTVFKYHQARRKTKNYLLDLEMLQYDMLYGERYVYDGESLEASDMQMGIKDINITGVHETNGGSLVVRGMNFTKWSKIYVNGEEIKTSYISPNVLQSQGYEIQDGDKVVVNVMGSSNTVFRSTAEYIYRAAADKKKDEPKEDDKSDEKSQGKDDGMEIWGQKIAGGKDDPKEDDEQDDKTKEADENDNGTNGIKLQSER